MPLFAQFSGKAKTRQINLSGRPSTDQASSSEALLAKARYERKARERSRLEVTSVLTIQRVWRGRRVGRRVKKELLRELDVRLDKSELSEEDWVLIARTLMVAGWKQDRRPENDEQEGVLLRCCERGIQPFAGKPYILARSGIG
jgi:hypothetical protein